MIHLLDLFASPPMVVLSTDDRDEAAAVAKRYATRVGRPIAAAEGPRAVESQFLPTLPAVMPVAEPQVVVVPPVEEPDVPSFSAEQMAHLTRLGVKV